MGLSIIANASDDISLNVNSNETSFIVTLDANPTTGYQWSVVQFDKKLLTLTKSQFLRPKTNLIGAGGQMQYTFTLNKGKTYSSKTKMVFKYSRSWEPQSATVQNVIVHFTRL